MGKKDLARKYIGRESAVNKTVVVRGAIRATATTTTTADAPLGNWIVGGNEIAGGDIILNSGGWIQVGTQEEDVVRLDASDETWRIWAGASEADSAPFRVDKTGEVWADDAHIVGEIIAASGELQTLDVSGTLTIAPSGAIQSSNFVTGESGFRISGDGVAEFQDVLVRGELHAVTFVEEQISVVKGTLDISSDEDGTRVLAQELREWLSLSEEDVERRLARLRRRADIAEYIQRQRSLAERRLAEIEEVLAQWQR